MIYHPIKTNGTQFWINYCLPYWTNEIKSYEKGQKAYHIVFYSLRANKIIMSGFEFLQSLTNITNLLMQTYFLRYLISMNLTSGLFIYLLIRQICKQKIFIFGLYICTESHESCMDKSKTLP